MSLVQRIATFVLMAINVVMLIIVLWVLTTTVGEGFADTRFWMFVCGFLFLYHAALLRVTWSSFRAGRYRWGWLSVFLIGVLSNGPVAFVVLRAAIR